MKRGTRPFIVEVRRGQKRAAIVEGEEETGLLRNDALRRAEAALFGTPAAEHNTEKPESVPAPRRILASLTEPEPVPVFADDEPRERKAEKTEKTTQPRQDRRRRSQDSAGRSVPLTPELVSAALDQIEKVAHADEPRTTGSQAIVAPAGDPDTPSSVRRKTTGPRRVAPAQKQELAEAATARARAVAPAKRATPIVQNATADTPPRRPSIRGRYVFGTEPKPGEKWKRRLRWIR